MPNTMRAWTFTTRGPPSSVLKLRNDFPRPTPAMLGPTDVLIKVSHVAIFQGFASLMAKIPHLNSNPWIPEWNFSGKLEAVGTEVHDMKAGDAVFGSPDAKTYTKRGMNYNGMLVEYAILPRSQVVRKPENITFEGAAGLAADGCTSLQFCRKTHIQKGDKVLVCAASSGLGSILVQIIRDLVGEDGIIVGTCSAANADLVKGLGVDEVIDYRAHPRLNEYLAAHHSSSPFDTIIDIAGTDDNLYFDCPRYLKPEGSFMPGGKMDLTHGDSGLLALIAGVLTILIRPYWPVFLGGVPRKHLFHSGHMDQKDMKHLPELVESGKLRGVVDSVWEMEDLLKAYERIATRRARGKIIVHVQDV